MRLSAGFIVQSTIFASLFFTQVIASMPLARDSILARQASKQQCDTTCGNFEKATEACGDDTTSCMCTSAIAKSFQDCVDCTIALASSNAAALSGAINTDQQSISIYMSLCPGFTVTVPGGGGNTGTPTAPVSTADAGKTTSTGTAGSTSSAKGSSASTTPTATSPSSGPKSTSGALSPGSNIGSGSHLVVVSGLVWAMGIILAV